MVAIIEQLEKQRDGYKAELENQQRSPMKSLNNSRNVIEQDSNNEWKTKYENIEQKLQYILEDKQKTERFALYLFKN